MTKDHITNAPPEIPRLSITELAVLGVLAEEESHGFAVAKQLRAGSDIGRILTVRRPLVYRALDRLGAAGLAEPVATEKGDGGPQRVIHRVTDPGRRVLEEWRGEPVSHIRELRIEFLLKLTLLVRAGQSPLSLIERQRSALEPAITALHEPRPNDHIELWRRHNAVAAASYLDDLESRYRPDLGTLPATDRKV